MAYVDISDLLGKTLVAAYQRGDEEIVFDTVDGERFVQYHEQSCCEGVYVESVSGDLSDLIGSPILQAEEITYSDEDPPEVYGSEQSKIDRDSWTWTFYKLATIKGSVTIRWLGESNGYYSESVHMRKDTPQ